MVEVAEVKEEGTGEREGAERGETAWLEEMVRAAGEIKAVVSKGVGAALAGATLAEATEEDGETEGLDTGESEGSDDSDKSAGPSEENGGEGAAT